MFKFIILSFGLISSIIFGDHNETGVKPKLKGITTTNFGFTRQTIKADDPIASLFTDFSRAIAYKAGFELEFDYVAADTNENQATNGTLSGMIGAIYNQKATFAIGNLTAKPELEPFVDFSEPLYQSQIAAIIRREDAINLSTLEDLLNENQLRRQARPLGRVFIFTTIKNGPVMQELGNYNETESKLFYKDFTTYSEALVGGAEEGLAKAASGHFAFMTDSLHAQLLIGTGKSCILASLPDTTMSLYTRDYVIALPKGSPHLPLINHAIRELKAEGTVDRLIRKWSTRCSGK